ncbi:DHH family phosphoesterase (plasmid) [Clostridium perfringens]
MKNIYDDFANVVDKYNTFCILMHNNPDGDSIASMFAMQRLLEKKNKKVQLAIHNPIPENFKFWFDKHINKVEIPAEKSECLIIVDTPNPEKTYDKYKDLADFVVVVDHHKNSIKFGDLNIVKMATCTGVIIYEILKHMNINIDKQLAETLFISLCWDTDGFKNSFATSYIYSIASELIDIGAVPQRVFRYLFEYKKKNEIKVQRLLFNSVQELGKINYIKIHKEDLDLLDNNDIYNFLNYIKLLDNLDLFLIFVDRGDYFEIKMNNNQPIYIYLKNSYEKLYKIKIKDSFDVDVDNILAKLNTKVK